MFLPSGFAPIMQLINGLGTSAIITNVAFATVTDYTFIWIIQVVQIFLLTQKFSFKCLMTPEMAFKILNSLNAHSHTHKTLNKKSLIHGINILIPLKLKILKFNKNGFIKCLKMAEQTIQTYSTI